MKNKIETLYLDWFNNFLTVERFAEYYGMSVDKAHRVIRIGRYLNQRRNHQIRKREMYWLAVAIWTWCTITLVYLLGVNLL